MGSQVAVQPQGSVPHSQPNPLINFMPLIFIFAVMYFLIIRPQQKQAKELKGMLENMKAGDRVLLQGGIFGNVVQLNGPVVIVRIAEGVKVEVNRSAIAQVISPTSNGSASDPAVTVR